MIEGFAREMPEDEMAEAIMFGPRHDPRARATCSRSCIDKVGAAEDGLRRRRRTTACTTGSQRRFYDELKAAKQTAGKHARADAVQPLKDKALAGVDSRSDGRRRVSRRTRSATPGTPWKSASSAT